MSRRDAQTRRAARRLLAPGTSRIADDLPRGIGISLLRFRTWVEAAFWMLMAGMATVVTMVVYFILRDTTWRSIEAVALWVFCWTITDAIGATNTGQWTVQTSHGDERWTSLQIRQDPWFIAQATNLWQTINVGFTVGLFLAIPACILTAIGARWAGKRVRDQQHVRGREIVPDTQLEALVKRSNEGADPELRIGRVPLIRGTETQHTLFLGSTGVGKTTGIVRIMEAARERGDAAVVYDVTGDLTGRLYRPDFGDRILNPLDARSPPWSPWAEIRHPADADRVAASLIPLDSGSNQFFSHAARSLFAAALTKAGARPDRSLHWVLEFLLTASREDKEAFFQGTEAAKYYAEKADRAGASVDMNAATFLRSLRYLPATSGGIDDFSITEFMANVDAFGGPAHLRESHASRAQRRRSHRPPWLFLPAGGTEHEALKPLITCWVDSAVAALMSLRPRVDRRVWFFLDELYSLHEVPSLSRALAEGRKYGICGVVGLQDTGQLDAIYGRDLARTMLSLMNTKALFRVMDPGSAKWVSELAGQAERERAEENARYGMQDSLEGLNISTRRATESVVLGAEVQALRPLECLVLLPGPWPVARTRLAPPQPLPANAEPPREAADPNASIDALLRRKATGAPSAASNAAADATTGVEKLAVATGDAAARAPATIPEQSARTAPPDPPKSSSPALAESPLLTKAPTLDAAQPGRGSPDTAPQRSNLAVARLAGRNKQAGV
jgi:type IV conjugative transfer system coupling protein TraD